MFNNVIFYLAFHNGDIHLPRSFVKLISAKVKQINPKINIYFSHVNDPYILHDLEPDITFKPWADINNAQAHYIPFFYKDDSVYINCWLSADVNLFKTYEHSFDTLYCLFNNSCKSIFNFELKDIGQPIDFIPEIDWARFHIKNIDNMIEENKFNILICNGKARSNQCDNFCMNGAIRSLANKYPEIDFYLTNLDEVKINQINNIKYTTDIITDGIACDLNEVSYLSTKCKIICGRESGPMAFCATKSNLMRTDLSYLLISNLHHKEKYWIREMLTKDITWKARIEHYNLYSDIELEKHLEDMIRKNV